MTQQVFISYSNESPTDRQVADKIYDTLKARGIPCWVAHRDIAAGQKWPDAISKAISNSRAMIVVLSEHTQKSSYVGKEVTLASNVNLTIIPFCIEKVSLSGSLKFLLSDCQWINAYLHPWDKALEQLIESLQKHLEIEPEKVLKKKEKQEKPLELDIAPIFVRGLKLKCWDVKKNESDCWEAFYKTYDLTMINIPPGKFMMGSNDGDVKEKPPHEVDLDGYWIGKYEVTFAQYDRYCEETGKTKPGDEGWGRENRPVISVSWDDAVAYCQWLSRQTGLKFDLPSEAQWEKAARGPGSLIYPWGNEFDKNKCNSAESGLKMTSLVELYLAGKSPYGCMDMAGNVWEWCADWYDKDYYKNSPARNPMGPAHGSVRVRRGGSCVDGVWFCRAASRNGSSPANRADHIGFRLMMII